MSESRSASASADDAPPEFVAGWKLPNHERISLLVLCRRWLLGDACAALKSAEILAGGGRVCNAAVFALALTAIEDAFALQRARQSCRSTLALLAVERDHALHIAGEAVRRTGLMMRIAREVGEEAVYPLSVRFELLLENLYLAIFP